MAMTKLERKSAGDDIKFSFKDKPVGTVLEGYYQGAEKFHHNGKELTKHRFKDENGKIIGILGTYGLNEDLPQVPVGSFTRITFQGKKPLKGGRSVNEFSVEFESNGL